MTRTRRQTKPAKSATRGRPSYLNPDLPINHRVDDLVSRMTTKEKVSQILHDTAGIQRLGIPDYNYWNEALHGMARAGQATVFPQAIGMAASFDDALMHRVATAISDEMRAKHYAAAKRGNRRIYFGLNVWSPNINIFRDPRWGRGQETYGEDPFLTSRMGVAYVKGMQGNDPHYLKIAATPKHYAVHSGPERNRHSFDAKVSQRDLFQTYLPAFEACVREAKAESVMGAYNRVNGEAACASTTLLQKILREKWGFDGHVVSDCGAIWDIYKNHKMVATQAAAAALAVKNGCDLNCGGAYASLLEALDKRLITEQEIETALKRVLRTRFRLGMFDPPSRVPYSKIPSSVVRCDKHVALARKMAQESIVLLKNQDGLLPLNLDKYHAISVQGPNGSSSFALRANYHGLSPQMVTVVEGIVGAVPLGVRVSEGKACNLLTEDRGRLHEAVYAQSPEADAIVAVVGLSPEVEGEEQPIDVDGFKGGDRTSLDLPAAQMDFLRLLKEKVDKPVVVVVMAGSAISLQWIHDNFPAVIMAWYPGEQGGNAIADVLFGKYNPAGRLPVTFYRSVAQLPAFENYSMKGRTYRFFKGDPLYPFGYGLSYTQFKYTNLRVTPRRVSVGERATVEVTVRNTGKRAGDEVVQIYIHRDNSSVPTPVRQLAGFRRVRLKPGASRKVSFRLAPRQLSVVDNKGEYRPEPGAFTVWVGGCQPGYERLIGRSTEVLKGSLKIAGSK